MPPAGFESTIPASERPQNHILDRAATGIGNLTLPQRCFWRFMFFRTWRRVVGWVGRDVAKDCSDVILWAQAVPGPWNEETAFPRKVGNHSRKDAASYSGTMIPFHVLFLFGVFTNILSFFGCDKKVMLYNLTGVFRFEIISSIKNGVLFRFVVS